MHTWESLMKQLEQLGIVGKGTLLVHSSMKSMGHVEGGADTVLDALTAYMKDGWCYPLIRGLTSMRIIRSFMWISHLLVSGSCPSFSANGLVWCVRAPTHSVAALGQDAKAFTNDDHRFDTPCARGSAWGSARPKGDHLVSWGRFKAQHLYSWSRRVGGHSRQVNG